MKRITLILILFSSMVFLPRLSLAAGPATVYQVTLTKMELYNGTSFVTVFDGSSTTIDIAAANSGAAAGNFLSGLSVPDGTYSQARATPSTTFVIQGNDGARYTDGTVGTNNGCDHTNVAANAAECTVTVSSVDPATQTFSAPITVTNGVASHKIRVSFDVSGAVSYNAGADELFPAAPTVTITTITL